MARLDRVSGPMGRCPGQSWDHWVDLPAAGDLVGELTGAAGDRSSSPTTPTVNLYKLACAALDARPGRRVIVTDADNFPSDRYVLEGIAAQRGAELRMLATESNEGLTADAVAAAVDDDTALVSLSHVAYRSGALADMAAITEITHGAGALMLWDLCHSVGAVPIELDACDVDLAVGCTYKYLNSVPVPPRSATSRPGCGDVLRQPIWAGSPSATSSPWVQIRPAAGIAKFTTGTPSILGTARWKRGQAAARGRHRADSRQEHAADQLPHSTWPRPGSSRLAARWPHRLTLAAAAATSPSVIRWRAGRRSAGRANVITDYRTPERPARLPALTTRFTDVWRAARTQTATSSGRTMAEPWL